MPLTEFKCPKCKRELSYDTSARSDAWCARCNRYQSELQSSALERAKVDCKRLGQLLSKHRRDDDAVQAALNGLIRSVNATLRLGGT